MVAPVIFFFACCLGSYSTARVPLALPTVPHRGVGCFPPGPSSPAQIRFQLGLMDVVRAHTGGLKAKPKKVRARVPTSVRSKGVVGSREEVWYLSFGWVMGGRRARLSAVPHPVRARVVTRARWVVEGSRGVVTPLTRAGDEPARALALLPPLAHLLTPSMHVALSLR